MLNGLGFELPLLTSFPDTSNGSGKEVFFIARKVKLCESPSKAGGLPILISLNKTQWSKIQPHLSGRAATGRPPADDKRTLEAILFVLTTGVDGALFPLNTAVMSRHGEDIGDGHKMEPLTVYGTCSFLSLNSKENLISKNVHWMARLYEQKGGPTSRQNLWRFNQ